MRIKKLEIVGFKSFCDRVVLPINDPITCVIGPNGCGKSNVVDAIRWCMGEQSAKHLRGKAMEDVIFAGSDRRGPLGYCEVALTFENDGRVPIEYLHYSEITVGRRLFRDGTSEYYMNKTPCRLRDITEFFMGTGIGTRAYSIIEQGRVGLIVTSKPEERRLLIEEAAGITKYKVKRKAAEKKMELTRQNLLRISDVTGEQEKQLGTLRRQAEKAERYKRYRAELRDIELWGQSQRWLGLSAEEKVHAAALAEMAAERERAQAELLLSEGQLEAARLSLLEEEQRLQALFEEVHGLDHEVKLGEKENEHRRAEAARHEAHAEKLRRDLASEVQKAEEARLEHARLAEELARLTAGGTDKLCELDRLEERLRLERAELAEAGRRSDAAKAEIGRIHAEIARAEADERGLVRHLDDLSTRLLRLAEERRRLLPHAEKLREHVAEQEGRLQGLHEEKVTLVRSRAAAEERLKDLKHELGRLDKEVDQLRGELHKKRARLHSLSEIAAKYEGFAHGTRAILLLSDRPAPGSPRGMRGVVADMLIVPEELEVAVEAVLGERLGALITESQEDALAAILYLRKEGKGRASFVPLSARPTRPGDRPQPLLGEEAPAGGTRGRLVDLIKARPGYEAVLDALLGNVLLLPTATEALDYYAKACEEGALSPGGLIVTLDGILCDGHGVLSGGAPTSQGASVLSQKRELRETELLLARMEERFREKDERLAVVRGELQHLQRELDELSRAGHHGEIQILSLDKDLLRSREELLRTLHKEEVLAGEARDLGMQEEELRRQAEEVRVALGGARQRLLGAEEARDRAGREHLARLGSVEQLTGEITHLKVQVASHRERVSSLAHGVARLEQEAREREALMGRMREEEALSTRRAAELRAEIGEHEARLLKEAGRRAGLAEELSALRAAYEAKKGLLSEQEGAVRERRARDAGLLAELTRLSLRLSEVRARRAHIEEVVLERHRTDVRFVVSDFHLRPQMGEKEERRMAELRDLIDRMGEINLMAIEHYEELARRHDFLIAQKTDLETGLSQLERAITLINRTCRKRFREVFDLVNSKFQEIFPRCFLGGQARLVLTREDDLLESGIEIIAQPPGKKNQTVELLSGGEKAMTAVALIFAIFLIKPSPFCLLDEVDAPLDEANVGRFNDLIREMTDRSQFIIITHNKRTMQIGDTLYGVTMEEPGVSKVVTLSLGELSKIEKKAGKARAA